MELTAYTLAVASILFPAVTANSVDARATDAISSCGSAWMPRNDVTIAQGTDHRTGFGTAVQVFCDAANGKTVPAGGYLSMATEVFLNGGKDASTNGVVGFVYCKFFSLPSLYNCVLTYYFSVEVHNKQNSDHSVTTDNCKRYLLALSADGGWCSGEKNHDTKGGTWQVGNNAVSYHALGQEVPPRQDALNKLFTGGAISEQSVNKGAGPALNPWPFDSLNQVRPVACHSHNDYTRRMPLFSAMSAGCAAFEADVFYSYGDVIIGHTSPTPGRTLRLQYVDPLRAILDHNNGGSPGPNGVYRANPGQSIVLMVDFKTSDTRTLDAVVKALQPLRDGGYLSHVADGKFVEKQVTVVASGNSPFDRINSGDGVPNRDVFYDAKVDNLESKYNNLNSYYASADFKRAVGNPSSVGSFTEEQKNKVREQVGKAHAAGLKVRYWNLPGDYMWEPLAELGVDRLNADDMYATARLRRL